MAYKTEYKITLKRAKEVARKKLGRLPKAGHEISIAYLPSNWFNYPDDIAYRVYLANNGGRFRLWQWYNPCYHEIGYDMSKVIEG